MISLDDLPRKRDQHGIETPLFISRYMFNRPSPYRGPILSNFYADFDNAEKPHHALMELLDLAERFWEMGIDATHLKLRFTGGKGGSIEVPYQYFNAKPSEELPQIWRKVAEYFKNARHYKTLDLAVYDRRRLWRLTNTKHKSGRYKVPLTIEILKIMTFDQILDYAKEPKLNYLNWNRDDREVEADPIVNLRALYRNFKKEVNKEHKEWKKRLEKRVTTDFDENKIFPCVVKLIKEGISTENFQRNPTAFNIAVALSSLGADTDFILDALIDFAERCEPPFPKVRYPELEHCIQMAKTHDYTTHCKTPCFEAACVEKKNCWVFVKVEEEKPKIEEREIFTPDTIEEAQKLLESPDILDFIATSALGDIFMEHTTKMALFLLQLGWQSARMSGETSTGKSHVTDRVMECFPKHWWIKYTGTTDKYIRHMPDYIRTIYFAEFAAVRAGGAQESTAEYDMKIIMSEGKLLTGVVEKVEGHLTGVKKEVVVENFITTSTDVDMAPELRNRQWELSTDRTINLPYVKYRAAELSRPPWERINCKRARTVLRCAVEIIDNEAPKKWWVPYMDQLVPIFEPLEQRTDIRRNIEKLNKLIIACAKLHYKNRPTVEHNGVAYGIALPEDFYNAWRIGDEAIMGTLTEVTRYLKYIWSKVEAICIAEKKLNSNALSSMGGMNQDNAKKWLNRFKDMGLLGVVDRDSSGEIFQRTVETTLEGGRPKDFTEKSVVITLYSLYRCIYKVSTAECIKNSEREFSQKKVVVLYPATLRRFSLEELPDDFRRKLPSGAVGTTIGTMRGSQFRVLRGLGL